jgi:serine/threonine-protein kinase
VGDTSLEGRAVGDFIVHEKLGEGGFGAVYRAEQPRLNREAVLKVLRSDRGDGEPTRRRFLREAQLAARFDHPFAAHVYDCGAEPDGLLWIAMEIVRGTPLDAWLKEHGPFAPQAFVPLCERICAVVQSAHEQGIVHRDLKPANVMVIERAGELLPKLLDFGIAKAGHAAQQEPEAAPAEEWVAPPPRAGAANALWASSDDASTPPSPLVDVRVPDATQDFQVTRRGSALGSPPYMAPEQWLDAGAADARSDLYALGVLCYEALAGRRPFKGETREEIARAHAEAPVPPLGPGFPPALDDFFQRALAKRPSDRFGSAHELAVAFAAAAATRRWPRIAALALLATLAATAAFWWWSGTLPASDRRAALEVVNTGAPEDGWLQPVVHNLATRSLRAEERRFALADAAEANVGLRIVYRRTGEGVELTTSARRAWGRWSRVGRAQGASVAAALQQALPVLRAAPTS